MVLPGDLIQVTLPSLELFLGNIMDIKQDPQYIWNKLVALLLKVPNLGSCLQCHKTNLKAKGIIKGPGGSDLDYFTHLSKKNHLTDSLQKMTRGPRF